MEFDFMSLRWMDPSQFNKSYKPRMELYLLVYGQTHRQLRRDQILDTGGSTLRLKYGLLNPDGATIKAMAMATTECHGAIEKAANSPPSKLH
jgi:hypothetical protein